MLRRFDLSETNKTLHCLNSPLLLSGGQTAESQRIRGGGCSLILHYIPVNILQVAVLTVKCYSRKILVFFFFSFMIFTIVILYFIYVSVLFIYFLLAMTIPQFLFLTVCVCVCQCDRLIVVVVLLFSEYWVCFNFCIKIKE